MLLLGADVGGTFTDIVLTDTDSNRTLIHKVSSTPQDPSVGVLRGVTEICQKASVPVKDIDHVYHGTTVATNAALQYRGATAGMITTRGFRDIIHIGRHQRPQHYSIQQEIPWQDRPLVKRRYRKVVTERIAPPRGGVVTPLAETEVRKAALELQAAGVESIAICFLFSYLNPAHEQLAKEIVQQVCPGIFVTASHEVSPQFREFERFTTTALNAFIGPLVRNYITELSNGLAAAGFGGEMHIMQSNGGIAPARTISKLPVYTLMSGLAAGVLGGAWIGRQTGRSNVITLDIGGTSADIGVVTNDRFSEASARDTMVAGYPILVPMIDLHTIGAGGGSIAHIDNAGAFKVGPESAGAVPGPAAYGQGGTQPTVTDANIVLGRLDASNFLGGAMKLDIEAAHTSIARLAEQMGLPVKEAAAGVVAILNSNMANAIRARTVQKGIDPREYALIASGGAGPLHGVEVARILNIPEVIIPPHPGINSAEGLLTTDLKYDIVRTAFLVSTAMDLERLNSDLAVMQAQLTEQLKADGVEPSEAVFKRSADARYVGQGYELRLPLCDGPLEQSELETAVERFHDMHQQEYGHRFLNSPVELVNLRITANSEVAKIGPPEESRGGSLEDARIRSDETMFIVGGELVPFQTNFYYRDRLPVDEEFSGPAIILQTDSTTVVPPDCAVRLEKSGSLVIRVDEASAATNAGKKGADRSTQG
ncbi:MAG: hydantoinase/oxoprolinase family protein [Xanthomonadales bacterium]|nr:hydantoinase/oxoprolinase family protein [Xanthomonadales bacterium]